MNRFFCSNKRYYKPFKTFKYPFKTYCRAKMLNAFLYQKSMANKSTMVKKKELAKELYLNGDDQKSIAEKVGVAVNTVGRWAKNENWKARKTAVTLTRPELVNKMLLAISNMLDAVNGSDDPMAMGDISDKLSKFAATIEKLDKNANVVTTIDVLIAFNKWLQYRMTFDKELTPEMVKAFNKYQDLYISEKFA